MLPDIVLTGGNIMEIWDGYNADKTLAGVDIVRGGEFPKGLYHIVVDVIVRHKDGMYLVMQRDYNKEGWPGAWEIGAGGSVLKGESPHDGAIRELYEETGVRAEQLTLLSEVSKVHENGVGVHYFIYLCETDIDKDAILLQEGETIDHKWIDLNELPSGDYITERTKNAIRNHIADQR